MPGSAASVAELTNISQHGVWWLVEDREFVCGFSGDGDLHLL